MLLDKTKLEKVDKDFINTLTDADKKCKDVLMTPRIKAAVNSIVSTWNILSIHKTVFMKIKTSKNLLKNIKFTTASKNNLHWVNVNFDKTCDMIISYTNHPYNYKHKFLFAKDNVQIDTYVSHTQTNEPIDDAPAISIIIDDNFNATTSVKDMYQEHNIELLAHILWGFADAWEDFIKDFTKEINAKMKRT